MKAGIPYTDGGVACACGEDFRSRMGIAKRTDKPELL
jgi:hypothetical protein